MEPISSLFGGAGALMQGAAALISAWKSSGKRGTSNVTLRDRDTVGELTTTDEVVYLVEQPTALASIFFAPADETTGMLLDVDMPVMLVIAYGEPAEPIDISITSLGTGAAFGVVDGLYTIEAHVLESEALEAGEISAIAMGSVRFIVDGAADQFEIGLEVTVADELINVVIDEFQCRALTSKGHRCQNFISDETIVLCTLHRGRLEKGYQVLDYEDRVPFK